MELLEAITELSHAYGTDEFVKAGGGNTSCKTRETLWVKPSGIPLSGLAPDKFVAMDRAVLSRLYSVSTPSESAARETLVKEMMAAAVRPETPGRASVEAPLHDSLSARFVVHTHPALVNGLTCAIGGAEAAARLFPDALWVPYTDPGYTLCMAVRQAISSYRKQHGLEPTLVFLENHGVFVSGDTAEAIHSTYSRVINSLRQAYHDLGVSLDVDTAAPPADEQVADWQQVLLAALGEDASVVIPSGRFEIGNGPISPDHIVYAKSYPFDGVLTVENLKAFVRLRGYAPRLVLTENAVLGVGRVDKTARLALELALDGAHVKRLARAFGGLKFLSDDSRLFIENWEVESYRAKQVL